MNDLAPRIAKTNGSFPPDARIVENLPASLEELFFIAHPQYKKRIPEISARMDAFVKEHEAEDCWVYYPWRNIAVHTVSEPLYFRLRTARNRNVITDDEQKKYRDLVVGVAGLSVGSAVLAAVAASGGPKKMKIADFDVLEVTNLNRIRAGLPDIGSNKTHIAAQKIWELDPFADLTLFDKGITRENVEDFILGAPRLEVFVDEMDSIDLKIIAREICRKNKIPVLMATDNGDGIILDVERFDLEPARPMFHGLIPEFRPEELSGMTFPQWLQLATKIVGPEYLTEAMQRSLLEIGKTIPSVPQLGASAAMAGSAMSFVLRTIAAGEPMESGRYTMGLEEKLVPHYMDAGEVEKRKKNTDTFLAAFSKKPA